MYSRRNLAFLAAICFAVSSPASAQEAVATTQSAPAAPERLATADSYVRVREEPDGFLVLELASRIFVPAGGGPRIHLVAAVHIADPSFYESMQMALDKNDLVLFEGVKPPGAGSIDPAATDEQRIKATRGRLKFLLAVAERFRDENERYPGDIAELVDGSGKRSKTMVQAMLRDAWNHPIRYQFSPKAAAPSESGEAAAFISDGPDGISGVKEAGDDIRVEAKPEADGSAARKGPNLQQQMAKALRLTFQLDAMESSKPNWRRSDISVDELQSRMEAAGADATALLAMLDGSSFVGKLAGLLLGFIGQSAEMSAMMKMMMVELLGSADFLNAAVGGLGGDAGKELKAMMKVILVERNGVVIEDLRSIIERERTLKNVAVFYGAAHMSDLEKRLTGELGYKADTTTWAPAIRVHPRETGYTPEQARKMREMMKQMLKAQLGK